MRSGHRSSALLPGTLTINDGLTPVFVAVEKHLDPGAGQMAARGLDIPCYFLNDAGSAGTIIGALSRMEIVVSMRLHALIFAAGQGIPLGRRGL